MPDVEARLEPQMRCSSREEILNMEHEQKPLLSTDEHSAASNVCIEKHSSLDPDNLQHLVCKPVNGVKLQSKMASISESLILPSVTAVEVCKVLSEESKSETIEPQPCSEGGARVAPAVPCPHPTFFLPSEEDTSDDDMDNGDAGVVVLPEAGLAPGSGNSVPTSTPPHSSQMPPSVSRAGVRLQGSRHVFTIVPVDSSELHTEHDNGNVPEAEVLLSAAPTTTQCITTALSSCPYPPPTVSTRAGVPYSHYNTVKGPAIGRRPLYNPYQTMTGPGISTGLYNPYLNMSGVTMGSPPYNPYQTVTGASMGAPFYHPYHTITGLAPSRDCLHRVPTFSKREYGIGGSSMFVANPEFRAGDIPPSLASVVLPKTPMPSPQSSASALNKVVGVRPTTIHRVRTMPSSVLFPNTLPLRQGSNQQSGGQPSFPLEQMTLQSINQLTVRSTGGLSVDVGSTDGRNVTVHGAVVSPEQLPFLPPLRYCTIAR
ncbi:hypothetical protein Hamer_G003278 [Homarus americanus]|uniref:Uncharacterized protein n=1 Tax=Homarus americanus TaxID=6706 RepID=A0A8J5N766_HOMAM|nr:hypothetical protein Hamer_G003278 [Homarus americanus]